MELNYYGTLILLMELGYVGKIIGGLFGVRCDSYIGQYPARVSFLENSREFFSNFTSRSRSRGIFISLFTLDLDFKAFSFHFSLSERVKAFQISLFFLEKKE